MKFNGAAIYVVNLIERNKNNKIQQSWGCTLGL